MRRYRRGLCVLVAFVLVASLPACVNRDGGEPGGGDVTREQVEVFSWWVGPGDQEGLEALVGVFRKSNPDVDFINATVAGGAGVNAKSVLAARLQTGEPPDSYQVHAGLELTSDISKDKVEDVTYLYDQQGWREKFPKKLLDALTVNGRIYSVPVNIHRSNLLWFNPRTLRAAGISTPPKTWSEFLGQVRQLRAKGIVPLAMGPLWTRKHLLENVLLGELGAEAYVGLWTDRTDWRSTAVRAALETYLRVLAASNITSPASDWQPALDQMISGAAAYVVMGDWADAYLSHSLGLTFEEDYDVVASPGSAGTFNFLSDTFTLSKGAPHRSAAEKWLIVCGSIAGQDVFNPRKGSIPARLDSDASQYRGYLATALADWRDPHTRVVGSLTHGVVADNDWNGQIDNALGVFIQDLDVPRFIEAVADRRSR